MITTRVPYSMTNMSSQDASSPDWQLKLELKLMRMGHPTQEVKRGRHDHGHGHDHDNGHETPQHQVPRPNKKRRVHCMDIRNMIARQNIREKLEKFKYIPRSNKDDEDNDDGLTMMSKGEMKVMTMDDMKCDDMTHNYQLEEDSENGNRDVRNSVFLQKGFESWLNKNQELYLK